MQAEKSTKLRNQGIMIDISINESIDGLVGYKNGFEVPTDNGEGSVQIVTIDTKDDAL